MNEIRIKKLSYTGFLILIFGSVLSALVLGYYILKLEKINEKTAITNHTYNSFLELKLRTENLLTSTSLKDAKQNWHSALEKFEKQFEIFKKQDSIFLGDTDNLWYRSNIEIKEIKELLEHEVLNPKRLRNRSLLVRQGEMFITKNNTDLYNVVISLVQKINYLMQNEKFLLDEFKKLDTHNKIIIDDEISKIKYYSILFPIGIIVITLILAIIISNKVSIIENELLTTQIKLENSLESIEKSSSFMNYLINTAPMRIFWKDKNSQYMGVNKLFLGDAGLESNDQIIGKNDFELPWKDTHAKLYVDDDKYVMEHDSPKINFEEEQKKRKR